MRRLIVSLGAVVAMLAVAAVALGASVPAWTTYAHDAARTGIDPDSVSPLTPTQAWQTPAPLDGNIYAQPLVYGDRVYVATQNDTIYALDSATGAVVWSKHLATAVPSSQLPCGDINPSLGITSTPVIDPSTGTIYAVGATWDGANQSSIKHQLFALDVNTGAPRANFPMQVDPPYPPPGDARHALQREALLLEGGKVVIGYGGHYGDCETYWGWLVAAPEGGTGVLQTFQVESGATQGAIWGSGNGPALDASGDIYAATGNGSSSSPDLGESVLKLDSNLALLDHWTPANWHSLDQSDLDLGGSGPLLLPDNLLLQTGKDGNAYLLRTTSLGQGVASPLATLHMCSGEMHGGAIYIAATQTIYAACDSGLQAATLNPSAPSLTHDGSFSAPSGAIGPPIEAGGLIWVAGYNDGDLFGLNPATGGAVFDRNLGTFEHFATPSAGGGRLFVANGKKVTAFTIATAPPPPPSIMLTLTLSRRVVAADGKDHTTVRAVVTGPGAPTFSTSDGAAKFGRVTGSGGVYSTTLTTSRSAHRVTITALDGSARASAVFTQVAPTVKLKLRPKSLRANGHGKATATVTVTVGKRIITGDRIVVRSSDHGEHIGRLRRRRNGSYRATITASRRRAVAIITAVDLSPLPHRAARAKLRQRSG